MSYIWIIVSVLIAEIVSLLLARVFDKGEKVDKGFVICYWRLSYRRKFIRTLCLMPILVIVLVYFQVTFRSFFLSCMVGTLLSILFTIQAVYNYKKWKKE